MRATMTGWVLALGLGCAAAPAFADTGSGLAVPTDAPGWARWQTRIAVTSTTPLWRSDLARGEAAGLKVQGLGVVSDYYFARMPLGSNGAGGFRATSGVLLGSGAPLWAAQGGAAGLSLGRRNLSLLPAHGGWGFAADVGLMALNAGSAVRFGRLLSGTQSVDELVRDLRLTPVLQLGVSYSF